MLDQVGSYFKSAQAELSKVAWPTRQETVQKTVLVVIISIIVALYLGALDYLFARVLEFLV